MVHNAACRAFYQAFAHKSASLRSAKSCSSTRLAQILTAWVHTDAVQEPAVHSATETQHPLQQTLSQHQWPGLKASPAENFSLVACSRAFNLLSLRGFAAKSQKGNKKKGSKVTGGVDGEKKSSVASLQGAGTGEVELEIDAEEQMSATFEAFTRELAKLRTGRASSGMLDHVQVDAYGSLTPLNRVATVTVRDAQLLSVLSFDPSMVSNVEKAIRESPMELNPRKEGDVVLVPVPPLTQELRSSMVKLAHKGAEQAKISIRRARKDSLDVIRKAKGDIPEDEAKRLEKEVEDLTKSFVKKVDDLCEAKEKELNLKR